MPLLLRGLSWPSFSMMFVLSLSFLTLVRLAHSVVKPFVSVLPCIELHILIRCSRKEYQINGFGSILFLYVA